MVKISSIFVACLENIYFTTFYNLSKIPIQIFWSLQLTIELKNIKRNLKQNLLIMGGLIVLSKVFTDTMTMTIGSTSVQATMPAVETSLANASSIDTLTMFLGINEVFILFFDNKYEA